MIWSFCMLVDRKSIIKLVQSNMSRENGIQEDAEEAARNQQRMLRKSVDSGDCQRSLN